MYSRKVKEKTLTFGVSGMLWRNALIMYDKETNSEWSHYTGICMKGKYKGEKLDVIQSVPRINYEDWLKLHKDTKILTHRKRDEDRRDVYEKYHKSNEIGRVPLEHKDDKLPLKENIIGVWDDRSALAIPYKAFNKKDFILANMQGTKIVVYKNAKSQLTTVWKTQITKDVELDLSTLKEHQVKDSNGVSYDLRTGKSDKIKGKLEMVNHMLTYWFSWRDFYPKTEVFESKKEGNKTTKN